jgi:hypothetical protein
MHASMIDGFRGSVGRLPHILKLLLAVLDVEELDVESERRLGRDDGRVAALAWGSAMYRNENAGDTIMSNR